jgi:hypothetical protein
MTQIFKDIGLKITIDTNLKIVNFLDVTLNLSSGQYQPYRKPNDSPLYINTKSNHPPNILKNLPASIERRLSDLSNDDQIFEQNTTIYQEALNNSGFKHKLKFQKDKPIHKSKNRSRKIIWFNPPYSKNVSTNIGQKFLKLIAKHFPKSSKLNKIFNKNTVKVSYSCMPNMASIIKAHNSKISNGHSTHLQKPCNCRNKDQCPLDGQCQASNVIYQCEVINNTKPETKLYIGLTERPFKQRYANHLLSFRNERYQFSTELSKYIWEMKRSNEDYNLKWSIHKHAHAYSNKSKRCNLCLTEKLSIIYADKTKTLNKRCELISKCRHENKFYLSAFSRGKF